MGHRGSARVESKCIWLLAPTASGAQPMPTLRCFGDSLDLILEALQFAAGQATPLMPYLTPGWDPGPVLWPPAPLTIF